MSTDSTNVLIGQENIIEKIDSYSIDTLPHSILLEGSLGCGKHTLCNYIGNKFGLEVVELSNNADRKDIDDIQFNPYPSLYIIDLSNVILKFQNSILKILEEPPVGAFLVCLCQDAGLVLETIKNRCEIITFNKYSKDILELFAWDYDPMNAEIALNLFNTPGMLLNNKYQPIDKIYSFAIDVINRIGNSSYSNVFTISDKIAFKNEKTKYDLDVFIQSLKIELYNRIISINEKKYYDAYKSVERFQKRITFSIFKQHTFENFLFELKEILNDNTVS